MSPEEQYKLNQQRVDAAHAKYRPMCKYVQTLENDVVKEPHCTCEKIQGLYDCKFNYF